MRTLRIAVLGPEPSEANADAITLHGLIYWGLWRATNDMGVNSKRITLVYSKQEPKFGQLLHTMAKMLGKWKLHLLEVDGEDKRLVDYADALIYLDRGDRDHNDTFREFAENGKPVYCLAAPVITLINE